MFEGLSAFPLTPLTAAGGVDEGGFARLVQRLAGAGVDSIGALGSTGSAAYLTRRERAAATEIAVANAGDVPVVVGVGALRTRDVLHLVDDAQERGVAGVLLPAMTYQPLTDAEVLALYEEVASVAAVPIVVYDNPITTHVVFSDELHGLIAQLPGVVSIKIPPVPTDLDDARARVAALRARLPDGVTIGVSGDAVGGVGLLAGCETWYSALAGVLPAECLAITRGAVAGDAAETHERSSRLQPFWALFGRYGSYRVVATIAAELGLVGDALPRPLRGLDAAGREAVVAALTQVRVDG